MINKEQFKGNWNQIKGKVKQKWGKLTDDELTEVAGKRDVLLGKLQTKYGYAKEKAEKELQNFERGLNVSEEFDEMEEEEEIRGTRDWDEGRRRKAG